MKKVAVVLIALLLLPSVAAANQFLAVLVSGHRDPGVNSVLGIGVSGALVQTGLFRESPRSEEFLAAVNAERQRQAISENRVAEIARGFGIQSVCFVSMSQVLDSYYINAKIVSTETGAVLASGSMDNSLATLADIRTTAAGLVSAMTGAPQHAPAPTPVQPPPQVQAFNQQQQFQQPTPQPQFQQPQQMQQVQQPQVIQLQPGQQILQGRDGQIIIVSSATQQQFGSSGGHSDFWKNRWIYLGGSLGFGSAWRYYDYYYCTGWNCYYDEDNFEDVAVAATFVADFPLLAPVVSLESGAVIGNATYGIYAMFRIGFISEVFEATNDYGVVIGSFTTTVGGTIGFKAGPGMLFLRGYWGANGRTDYDYVYTFSVGYKTGVGRSRR